MAIVTPVTLVTLVTSQPFNSKILKRKLHGNYNLRNPRNPGNLGNLVTLVAKVSRIRNFDLKKKQWQRGKMEITAKFRNYY